MPERAWRARTGIVIHNLLRRCLATSHWHAICSTRGPLSEKGRPHAEHHAVPADRVRPLPGRLVRRAGAARSALRDRVCDRPIALPTRAAAPPDSGEFLLHPRRRPPPRAGGTGHLPATAGAAPALRG